jgi:predicted metal-dependent HD superfamily phosphohydrolase
MIRATAGHHVPKFVDAGSARDCALFLDMDLTILGAPAAVFDAYEHAVRCEYDWVTEPQWKLGRRAVLAGFLARPAIYATAQFRASHETAARHNLERAIARLDDASSKDRNSTAP